MSVLYSSETPGGKLLGVPDPVSLEVGDCIEPAGAVAVGVARPELGRDVDILVVDSKSFDKLGLDLR